MKYGNKEILDTDVLYEELKELVEVSNEEYDLWSELAVEGIDYDTLLQTQNKKKRKKR